MRIPFSQLIKSEWPQTLQAFHELARTREPQVFLTLNRLSNDLPHSAISLSEIPRAMLPNASDKGANSRSFYQVKDGRPIAHLMFGRNGLDNQDGGAALSAIAIELVMGLHTLSRYVVSGILDNDTPGSPPHLALMDLAHNLRFLELDRKETRGEPESVSNGIFIVDEAVWQEILNSPELVYALNPREFEELVAQILLKKGFEVELTQGTHDGGKDIVASRSDLFGHHRVIVECKRYATANTVGIDVVQRLFGVQETLGATKGIIATSSFFTGPAMNFAKQHEARMTLWDYYNLESLLSELRKR